jgi:hypothetical protein
MGICHGNHIYNIDKKGARIACLTREEVVVLIRIKEIYVRIPQNYLSITIIKYISIDRKSIPLLVIIPGIMIIEIWFYEKMIGHELVIVSQSGYTNKGIYLT